MQVVLHIGLPKTGSSFLQDWHRLNRANLAAQGINAVPLMASHRIAVECLTGVIDDHRPDIRHIRNATTLDDALAETRTSARTTLLSSEYLHHCKPTRLRDFLASADLNVSSVLCYLRRQDHLCASAYAQEVKALGVATSIGNPGYTDALNWHHLRTIWSTGFPAAEIQFRNYETHRAEGTLLQSFKQALGATDAVWLTTVPSRNLSLSAEMTEVARILNSQGETFDPDILLNIQSTSAAVPFGLSTSMTHRLEMAFIESNRALARDQPEEFATYAATDWQSAGEDMTDRLDAGRLGQILEQYDRLAGSQLARLASTPPPATGG